MKIKKLLFSSAKYLLLLLLLLSFIIIIIIIIIIMTSNTYGTDLFHYRLGDVVVHDGMNNFYYNNFVKYYFRNSIGSEYKSKTNKTKDYKILFEIVKRRANNLDKLPTENELIIHLRIGDVIDWRYNKDIDDLLEGKNTDYYLKDYHYFINNLDKIKSKNINKIILIGGYHTKGDHSRSEEYVDKISNFLMNKNYKVEKRIDKYSADEDFIYMSNSHYFLKAGGGYSEIINKMVQINDKKILEN